MTGQRQRLANLALFDGGGLLLMGVLSMICAVIWRDITGWMVGVALITLGGIELRGRWFLLNSHSSATAWLVGAQIGLLLVILSYCFRAIYHPATLPIDQLPANLLELLENVPGYNGDPTSTIAPLLKVTYSVVMLVSVFYQGGMAMYYLRKTPRALIPPPPLPVEISGPDPTAD